VGSKKFTFITGSNVYSVRKDLKKLKCFAEFAWGMLMVNEIKFIGPAQKVATMIGWYCFKAGLSKYNFQGHLIHLESNKSFNILFRIFSYSVHHLRCWGIINVKNEVPQICVILLYVIVCPYMTVFFLIWQDFNLHHTEHVMYQVVVSSWWKTLHHELCVCVCV
jgi:hypothetical protein